MKSQGHNYDQGLQALRGHRNQNGGYLRQFRPAQAMQREAEFPQMWETRKVAELLCPSRYKSTI